MRRFGGIYPVLYAFFDRSLRLDEGAMRAQVEFCLAEGAHGIVVLGLVTEVQALSTEERQRAVAIVGRANGGRVPYAVTVAAREPGAQAEFARMAASHGADWVILQPPPGPGHTEAALLRHFGAIADALELPVAIQNNPLDLQSALSPDGLIALVQRHSTISLLKAEGWSVDIASVLAAVGPGVDAFGGHGGLEFLSLMRSGGAGLIPAPDCVAAQVAIYDALRSGEPAAVALAERLHKEVLPLIAFMTRGIPGMWCYGKRLMAKRLGLGAVVDRPGALTPTAFGLAESERLMSDVRAAEAALVPELRTIAAAHRSRRPAVT